MILWPDSVDLLGVLNGQIGLNQIQIPCLSVRVFRIARRFSTLQFRMGLSQKTVGRLTNLSIALLLTKLIVANSAYPNSTTALQDFSAFIANVGLLPGWEDLNLCDFDQTSPPLSPSRAGSVDIQLDPIPATAPLQLQFWQISEQKHQKLRFKAAMLASNLTLPSRNALSRCFRSYSDHFHKHYPFMHLASLDVNEVPIELTCAIAAIGAQFRFDSKIGRDLYDTAKSIVLNKLQRYRDIHVQLPQNALPHAYGQMALIPESNETPHDQDQMQLDLIRSLLLLIAYSAWDRDNDLLQDSFAYHAPLVQLLRREGLSRDPRNDSGLDWKTWSYFEGRRRLLLVGYVYLSVQSVAYNFPPLITPSEVDVCLPCPTAAWQAQGSNEWQRLQEATRWPQTSFKEAQRILIASKDDFDISTLHYVSPLGSFALLQALIQRIFHARQLQFGFEDGLRPQDVSELEYFPHSN